MLLRGTTGLVISSTTEETLHSREMLQYSNDEIISERCLEEWFDKFDEVFSTTNDRSTEPKQRV